MIDFNKILKDNTYGVLATLDGNRPRTRVFQYLFSDDNKVYFGTTNDKPVYAQIQRNPFVSFCSYSKDFSPVLSVSGKAYFVDDITLKARAMEEYPFIKKMYTSPDNPVFEIFYVDVEEIETYSFEEGPRKYKLK
ncbi:pyridoxamine 5'-phosphate oxidase family protein [Desulfobotulus sp. H1]|uniref:Pyridoxamine 5'-phosphate oxidase family protein n=1 Tax=Desulfobotulus pelophilus TaxID=2823377 RepID=A0ABT3N849_9BACT|nr:pyridoxamine 5'-phosphate oxidase family protein [Desulfobotulus pelophilus]MCW7753638.1 pyridoxamine 5'-phosphate oxidase family protein [Desulfobotulus pelophilus]